MWALVQSIGVNCWQMDGERGWLDTSQSMADTYAIDYSRPPMGTGSFGTVWCARLKTECKGAVAVKVLCKRRMKEMQVPPSLVRAEVKLMKECTACEHIVQLHDFVETKATFYLVMELCSTGNLDAAIKAETRPPPERQAAQLMRQLLAALAHLHAMCVCHRDVKPQNLLLLGRPSSEGARLKLGDFGIARRIRRGELLREKIGTPTFMAPEIHLLPDKSDGYSRGVDMWASGVVLVYMLTRKYPFIDSSGRLLREQLLHAELPDWSDGGLNSLLQIVQEVAGLKVEKPSDAARDLVRRLLMPQRSQRFPAEKALQHPWLDQVRAVPTTSGVAPPSAARPLGPSDGLCGLGLDRRPPAELPTLLAAQGSQAQHNTCVVCYGRPEPESGGLFRCTQCRHVVCAGCVDRLEKPECPYCRHRNRSTTDDDQVESCSGCSGHMLDPLMKSPPLYRTGAIIKG
mmetsp:Transcript_59153/g.152122  ORF Transcript_59153/g.152122 Transcript_59153/m.152122 type:complete len:458 (+) Transcript_59153:112-1485(+)